MTNPTPVNDSLAGEHAIHAMLASNAYHHADRVRFQVEKIGWVLVDMDGDPIEGPTKESGLTGFAYDIYEHEGSNDAVIALRGTDAPNDWFLSNLAMPFSIPYKQANKAVRTYFSRNPNRNLTVVGHSLGGGMALGCSVRYGVPAITLDPSPRIFDGLGDYHETAKRVVIYQDGEILEHVRTRWSKIWKVVRPEDTIVCRYDFQGKDAHRADILALEMLKQGVSKNPGLRPVLDAVSYT